MTTTTTEEMNTDAIIELLNRRAGAGMVQRLVERRKVPREELRAIGHGSASHPNSMMYDVDDILLARIIEVTA